MKIAYLCCEYPPRPHGGIGVFVYNLAHAMRKRGHIVTVFGSGPKASVANDDGIQVVTIPECRRRFVGWFVERLRVLRWLRGAEQSEGFDIIEVPEHGGMLPWPFLRAPVVVRLHLSWKVWWKHEGKSKHNRWMPYCERATLKYNPYWIACSSYILHETKRAFQLTSIQDQVIYNGTPCQPDETAAFSHRPLDADYVLFGGRISIRKGAVALALAAKRFLPKFPSLRLVYVGPGDIIEGLPAEVYLKRIIGSEYADRLVFPGQVRAEQMRNWMAHARAFVFPSRLEAFSLIVIEAMACRVPVVYSVSHSGPEAIEHGVSGLLADPNDSDDIARNVETILSDTTLARKMAEEAYQRVRRLFSLDRCVADSEKFYEKVMSLPKLKR